jgi:alcohol dehydrogenase (cytochrome c)
MLAGNDLQYLYHNSTLALNADTGKIVWYYQHVVDHWDFDHPFERLLVDTAVAPSAADVSWINPKIKPGERGKSSQVCLEKPVSSTRSTARRV